MTLLSGSARLAPERSSAQALRVSSTRQGLRSTSVMLSNVAVRFATHVLPIFLPNCDFVPNLYP